MEEEKKELQEENNGESRELGLKEEDYYDLDAITERIARRKQETRERKRKERIRFRIVTSVIVLVIAAVIFSFSSFFDVDSIEVTGNSYFTAEEIINMAHAVPGKNLIYHPDKGNITEYLENNPYIKDAKVKRQFPSTLVIEVTERKQIGAIKYDDEFLIIDPEGILLRKTKTTPKLTIIEGVVISKIEPGEAIAAEDEELLKQTLNILSLAAEKDVYFIRINMADMYIKAYVYDALICKGTYAQLTTAIKDDRLHKVLDRLFEDNIKRGTITFTEDNYASFVPTV